jgi:ketosteroid isomerase-like protein
LHPEIEWVNPPDAVEPGTRRGPAGFEGAQSAVGRAYSSIELDVERQVEHADTVGLIAELRYQGRGSGIEVPQRMGMLFDFRDGKLTRFEWSRDPEALLAGLGDDREGQAGRGSPTQ